MGNMARCWIAEGFSKSEKRDYEGWKRMLGGPKLTVGVDAAKQVFFQVEVIKSRHDRDGF
jgi:hypothetical protein